MNCCRSGRIDCFHFADELICHRLPAISGGITDLPHLTTTTTTTTARDFSGRIMDSLLIQGQRIFYFFIFFFLTESKSISIHFDPRFESIYCG